MRSQPHSRHSRINPLLILSVLFVFSVDSRLYILLSELPEPQTDFTKHLFSYPLTRQQQQKLFDVKKTQQIKSCGLLKWKWVLEDAHWLTNNSVD